MAQFEKHFTVEEASALLPELREILAAIRTARDHLVVDVESAIPVLRKAKLNGGGKEAGAYLEDVQQLNERLERLSELGVQIKDIDKGLVDFPHWRGDEEGFLCWHLGEDEIRYWHSIDSGFAGRQPI